MEGLMAASLYEPLTGVEEAQLQRHLSRCAGCTAEYDALRGLVESIPKTSVPFQGDLWPALRGQLQQPQSHAYWRWLSTAALAACAVTALGLGYRLIGPNGAANSTSTVASVAVSSHLQEAATLRQARKPEAALHVLQAAMQERIELTKNDADHEVGLMAAECADIWFEDVRSYEAAYDLYAALREQHYEVFTSNRLYSDRWNLLIEVSRDQFQPLYALDTARNSGSFEALEKIVAQRPEQSVGVLALAALQEQVAAEVEPGQNPRVASLERVRARLTEPAAIALVNLTLGDTYWKELDDTATARTLYQQVAESPQLALATQARKSINELNATQ
jgi:hypothetical protein